MKCASLCFMATHRKQVPAMIPVRRVQCNCYASLPEENPRMRNSEKTGDRGPQATVLMVGPGDR
jgi:hypothetical protein